MMRRAGHSPSTAPQYDSRLVPQTLREQDRRLAEAQAEALKQTSSAEVARQQRTAAEQRCEHLRSEASEAAAARLEEVRARAAAVSQGQPFLQPPRQGPRGGVAVAWLDTGVGCWVGAQARRAARLAEEKAGLERQLSRLEGVEGQLRTLTQEVGSVSSQLATTSPLGAAASPAAAPPPPPPPSPARAAGRWVGPPSVEIAIAPEAMAGVLAAEVRAWDAAHGGVMHLASMDPAFLLDSVGRFARTHWEIFRSVGSELAREDEHELGAEVQPGCAPAPPPPPSSPPPPPPLSRCRGAPLHTARPHALTAAPPPPPRHPALRQFSASVCTHPRHTPRGVRGGGEEGGSASPRLVRVLPVGGACGVRVALLV
jgi:hypothetical protein